jgi:hypothetical protein
VARVPDSEYIWPGGNLPRKPGSDGARVGGDDGRIGEPFAEFPSDHLGLHRPVLSRPALFHQLPPLLGLALGALEETAIRLSLQVRQEGAQGMRAVAHQANLDRIAQTDARRIEIDLNASGGARLW